LRFASSLSGSASVASVVELTRWRPQGPSALAPCASRLLRQRAREPVWPCRSRPWVRASCDFRCTLQRWRGSTTWNAYARAVSEGGGGTVAGPRLKGDVRRATTCTFGADLDRWRGVTSGTGSETSDAARCRQSPLRQYLELQCFPVRPVFGRQR